MPIKFSNLNSSPKVSITNKKIELASENSITQCFKINFSNYDGQYSIGKINFQVRLSEMSNDLLLTVYILNANNFNNISSSNINQYLSNKLSVITVEKSDEAILKNIDIIKILNEIALSATFEIYFAIKCEIKKQDNQENVTTGSFKFDFLDVAKNEVLVGELYNPTKESYLHRNIEQDISFVGKGKLDLFNGNLKVQLLDISTSSKEPIQLTATYNEKRSGIFGEHITANFEYQAVFNPDYIEIINSIGDSNYYLLMERDKALEKYKITPFSTEGTLYVNITDLSYILLFSNKYEMDLVNKKNYKIIFHYIAS